MTNQLGSEKKVLGLKKEDGWKRESAASTALRLTKLGLPKDVKLTAPFPQQKILKELD